MPSHPARFAPRVDALETRMVPSAVLTPAGYGAARDRIAQVVDRLAATGDVARADAALERAVRTIPDNRALLPALDAALTTDRVTTRTLMAGVNGFIRDRVATGDIVVPNAALRRTIGVVAPTAPPPSLPVGVGVSSAPPRGTTGPIAPPPAPTPPSLSVSIQNSVTSDLDVSFTQVVNGTRVQLTGVSIRAGATARFVPIITQNSSPITVSVRGRSIGYWEITAPADFSQLQIKSIYGRCYFYFG